jgi:hypothetical protein
MGYYIYAWLEEGNPNLEIVDAESKRTCMRWAYSEGESKPDARWSSDKNEIQKLFRQLLLLTCQQEFSNCRVFGMQDVFGDSDAMLFERIDRLKSM